MPAEIIGNPMRTVAPTRSLNMKRPPPNNTGSTVVSDTVWSHK